ncbi:porin family protein [Flavobacterium phragmitis]|uniref:Outer membrane protein beta-barrel domain-containing protein n=1 Tax=Flavobacterium phragmitis TaxID=739143 RepID=A0A1I1VXU5_9FLAO|nr:porin family protein [Flavobacterium phragmitis]SFD85420.1 Outer membrane protein beta-barrel domain-containing protein [Flavobacterium phragmitis]
MKKIIVAAVLFLATSATMNAQFVQIGVKAGVNFANQTGGSDFNGISVDKEGITNFHGGLVAELKLLEKFSIQPELLYTTQGATYKNAIDEFKNEMGYIAIPVMAKIYMTKSLSLELGPQASFLVSNKKEFDVADPKTFDFSLNAGLGLKVVGGLFVQARYGIGLTEISKEADFKNSVFQLSAGYMF